MSRETLWTVSYQLEDEEVWETDLWADTPAQVRELAHREIDPWDGGVVYVILSIERAESGNREPN